MSEAFDIIGVTAFGLEAVAVHELRGLGYEGKTLSTGRVLFRGGPEAIVRANLHLRSVDRVLVRVGHFRAEDFGVLFDAVRAIPWERWIRADGEFPVNGRSVKSQLSSVPACQRIVKKAIVERLRDAYHVETLPENGARVVIEVSLLEDHATLTIDTSGVGLHKRGYRPVVGEAAMKETLAAALVLLSPWRGGRAMIDPFCGNGTIAIEAAMIGRNIAPGLLRSFDAEQWADHWREVPTSLWQHEREAARDRIAPALELPIEASDANMQALAIARDAARGAGVKNDIRFVHRDFADIASTQTHGCLIANPPYGVRLGDNEQIEQLYRSFPLVLRRLPTWSFFILTSRPDFESLLGQPATKRRKLFNSQIECTYYSYLGPKPPWMAKRGRDAAGEQNVAPDTRDEALQVPREDESTNDPAPGLAMEPHAPANHFAPPSAAPVFGGLRERDLREAELFRACLVKNVRHLRRYPTRGITCYRVYERDMPDVPLIIDRYEDAAHVAEYEREHSRTPAQQADWWDAMRTIIAEALSIPPASVFMKEKRRQRGETQHEKLGELGVTRVVSEGGLRFEINLSDYIDTGLFLDHRLTREMVRDASRGMDVLNLFGYTGSFSAYAAAGGATSTTSVDLSNTYLAWARRNFELNNLWNPRAHRLVRDDVLNFLRTHAPTPSYDLAIIDPPTFSNSTSTERDWIVDERQGELFGLLLPLMRPRGVMFFSTNYRRFKLDEEALASMGVSIRDISRQTVPPEYRNKRIHRCWRLHLQEKRG